MTDSMTSIDRMTGAVSAIVLIGIGYWGGMVDWRMIVLGFAAMASYRLAWVRGRQSTNSTKS